MMYSGRSVAHIPYAETYIEDLKASSCDKNIDIFCHVNLFLNKTSDGDYSLSRLVGETSLPSLHHPSTRDWLESRTKKQL